MTISRMHFWIKHSMLNKKTFADFTLRFNKALYNIYVQSHFLQILSFSFVQYLHTKVILVENKNFAQITKIDLDFSGQKSKKSHYDSSVLLFKPY
ncbi:hypothetical protein BpHYR1_022982 [Brachionus plicatilis]|uniref:Uncharacterized protein n=1 Tax=Brachionus plicatilis TaxID=10195 RepID=A0A3M7SKT4_BRAPC|nr:hypothetical protein BpHYR1_022982 [Brachionus plicatilis]